MLDPSTETGSVYANCVDLYCRRVGVDPSSIPDCHGIQVTDKSGDSVNSLDPSLGTGSPSSDLTAGWFTYDAAAGKATANIQVAWPGGKCCPWRLSSGNASM